MKRTRISRPLTSVQSRAVAEAFTRYQAEHRGAGPLDVPTFAETTKKSKRLIRLAWSLIDSAVSEDKALEALRDEAGIDVEQLSVAECELRATGLVPERSDYYRCWWLLCSASGEVPESLPIDNQLITDHVEEFLLLSKVEQLEYLRSSVPGFAELVEGVRLGRIPIHDAIWRASEMFGPNAGSGDDVIRSMTARNLAEHVLARAIPRR